MEGMLLYPYLDDKPGYKKDCRKIVIQNEQVKGIKLEYLYIYQEIYNTPFIFVRRK